MPRQSWTGFYLIWVVALAICAVLILAPSRERDRQAAGFQAGASAAMHSAASEQRSSPRQSHAANAPVWVNTRSHIYHYPGQRWYGHTVERRYMSEADAIKEGDRATQNGQ